MRSLICSWCLPLLLLPPLHSFISSSPPGSYGLAPNQLDAAMLGSAALARDQCLRSWHCGKPEAARRAHDHHLVAEGWGHGVCHGARHGAELHAGSGMKGCPPQLGCITALQSTPALPSSQLDSHFPPALTALKKGM